MTDYFLSVNLWLICYKQEWKTHSFHFQQRPNEDRYSIKHPTALSSSLFYKHQIPYIVKSGKYMSLFMTSHKKNIISSTIAFANRNSIDNQPHMTNNNHSIQTNTLLRNSLQLKS